MRGAKLFLSHRIVLFENAGPVGKLKPGVMYLGSANTSLPVAKSKFEIRLNFSVYGGFSSYRNPRFRVKRRPTFQSSWKKKLWNQDWEYTTFVPTVRLALDGKPRRKSA